MCAHGGKTLQKRHGVAIGFFLAVPAPACCTVLCSTAQHACCAVRYGALHVAFGSASTFQVAHPSTAASASAFGTSASACVRWPSPALSRSDALRLCSCSRYIPSMSSRVAVTHWVTHWACSRSAPGSSTQTRLLSWVLVQAGRRRVREKACSTCSLLPLQLCLRGHGHGPAVHRPEVTARRFAASLLHHHHGVCIFSLLPVISKGPPV